MIIDTLNELHKVQVNEHRLENISRIFGLLLDSSQARTEEVQKNKVVQICKEVRIVASSYMQKTITTLFADQTYPFTACCKGDPIFCKGDPTDS